MYVRYTLTFHTSPKKGLVARINTYPLTHFLEFFTKLIMTCGVPKIDDGKILHNYQFVK